MKIVFATNNRHKLEEVQQILGNSIEVLSLSDIDCHEDIPETGTTLEENALQKAQYVFDHYHIDCFADDTGLEVEALDGRPGVYSARYAVMGTMGAVESTVGTMGAVGHDSEANMTRLLGELANIDNRKARFRTVIALIQKVGGLDCVQRVKLFSGIVNGEITRERSGAEGFGYDPIFRPDGYDKTFAELGNDIKNKISHRAKATTKLCAFLQSVLFFIICCLSLSPAVAQTGSWQAYMSYYEPQQIVKAGSHDIFVRASNGLYQYNLTDQSITTFDKVRQLNDTYVQLIAWNTKAGRLLIVYNNANIDLLDLNSNVINISSLYTKSTTLDKTVNSICMNDVYAYLATGFGIVKINMQRAEISESYILNENITAVGLADGTIYAQSNSGTVWCGSTADNLIDSHNWREGTAPDGVFNIDNSAWNEYFGIVSTLNPGGPKYNNFGFLRFKNGNLYTVGGGYSAYTDLNIPGTPQVYNPESGWTIYDDDVKGKFTVETDPNRVDAWGFAANLSVDIDPRDSKHVYVSGRTGLYEYYDGELKNYFNKFNSILLAATSSNRYVLVESISFDKEGNLWLVQSQTANNLIEITKDGEWIDHNQSLLMDGTLSLAHLQGMMIDSRGYLWFTNYYWGRPSFYCYDPQRDEIVSYMTRLVNQDGTSAPENYNPRCLAEDLDGNIWLGTATGLYMIESSAVGSPLDYVTQVKVPRNDGTNYADYLMAGVNISSIVIDGGGRKWIGTTNNGIYLISADNMEQLENFTTDNSPLLSNNITSLAIDNTTGRLYIGTEAGLCSYVTDATAAESSIEKDNVYAYPNPVDPGYDGLITVVGLSLDADVKILSTSGQLVAQGRSNGGTFTWDGRDRSGKRVASGIYMVAAATSDGKKGTVCKIAVIR